MRMINDTEMYTGQIVEFNKHISQPAFNELQNRIVMNFMIRGYVAFHCQWANGRGYKQYGNEAIYLMSDMYYIDPLDMCKLTLEIFESIYISDADIVLNPLDREINELIKPFVTEFDIQSDFTIANNRPKSTYVKTGFSRFIQYALVDYRKKTISGPIDSELSYATVIRKIDDYCLKIVKISFGVDISQYANTIKILFDMY